MGDSHCLGVCCGDCRRCRGGNAFYMAVCLVPHRCSLGGGTMGRNIAGSSGTATARRQFGYVLASLSLLCSSLVGFAMLLLVRSGDQGLFILASIMTVSVASAISSRNAPMPRTAILAISLSAVPFLVAIGLLLPKQTWIALVAGLPLLASLWSLTLQNHKILVRLIIAERRARLLANTDALTGLPNRLSFLRHQDSLSMATGAKGGYAYICVDLDGCKAVNDNHVHPAGDLLLKPLPSGLRKIQGQATPRFGSAVTSSSFTCRARPLRSALKWQAGSSDAWRAPSIFQTACLSTLAAAPEVRALMTPHHLRP